MVVAYLMVAASTYWTNSASADSMTTRISLSYRHFNLIYRENDKCYTETRDVASFPYLLGVVHRLAPQLIYYAIALAGPGGPQRSPHAQYQWPAATRRESTGIVNIHAEMTPR